MKNGLIICSLFIDGQTGSGKSYSMVIIPLKNFFFLSLTFIKLDGLWRR